MGTLPTTADSKIGRSFSHGRFLNIINGAKMALKCLVTYPNMAICWGMMSFIPHI
jgi:hypothetical protein